MSKSPEFTSQDAQPFLPEKLIESQDSNATTKQIRIYHALNFIAATGIMITIGLSVVLAALICKLAVINKNFTQKLKKFYFCSSHLRCSDRYELSLVHDCSNVLDAHRLDYYCCSVHSYIYT